MSALTLVMKEVDMNAEEFVNVRAYHSRGKAELKPIGDHTRPICGDRSSSADGPKSEEEPTSPTPAIKTIVPWKDLKCFDFTKKDEKTPPKTEKEREIKIVHGGRNIFNLERNLQPHQWQLRSPLFDSLNLYMKPKSTFRFNENSGALDEIMIACSDCEYREPAQF